PTVCVLIGALSPAQARYGHFQGFYAGLNVGHQSVNTHYNFANAQFGNITPLSIIQTNIPSVGDTTTIKTSAVYSNGSGSFLQRGMTGGVTLGGGYV
ncbi:hypothetical protein, partial [Halomonas marinisediminis]|uniref:hypothetical protein n=1 Tax=Halomonas marinisediminis TaxID=2546095 RepID=UPI00197AB259